MEQTRLNIARVTSNLADLMSTTNPRQTPIQTPGESTETAIYNSNNDHSQATPIPQISLRNEVRPNCPQNESA
ncbi:MAG TPA: hypothetical protein VIJ87_13540 [Pyrinomonadaceae bacterium]